MVDQQRVKGGLAAEIEAAPPRSYSREEGGRLFLFRLADQWTLLEVRHSTRRDDYDRILDGYASADAVTYPDLIALKAPLHRDYRSDDWRALVKAGAQRDADLRALWTPVQIDIDLRESSVYRRELGVGGTERQVGRWEEAALAGALAQLEELGFVVLDAGIDVGRILPRLRRWSNPLVGAATIAKYGYRVGVVIAIDGAGEIYARTPDTNFDPGQRPALSTPATDQVGGPADGRDLLPLARRATAPARGEGAGPMKVSQPLVGSWLDERSRRVKSYPLRAASIAGTDRGGSHA